MDLPCNTQIGTPSVLVLGANGKLGRMLRRRWHDHPPRRFRPLWQNRTNMPTGDICWQPGQPMPELPEIMGILALWGVTPGPGRDLSGNSHLALAAMQLGADLGAPCVLHCSSAAVYEPGPAPLGEAQAGGRINAYGIAKLEMEHAVSAWRQAHPGGPAACMMRIANVAGADSLFATLDRGGPVSMDQLADGQGPWRSYITVSALAQTFEALLDLETTALPGTLNIAGRAPVAMEALARAAGQRVIWHTAKPGTNPMVALDTARLDQIIKLGDDTVTPEGIIADWHRYGLHA